MDLTISRNSIQTENGNWRHFFVTDVYHCKNNATAILLINKRRRIVKRDFSAMIIVHQIGATRWILQLIVSVFKCFITVSMTLIKFTII